MLHVLQAHDRCPKDAIVHELASRVLVQRGMLDRLDLVGDAVGDGLVHCRCHATRSQR